MQVKRLARSLSALAVMLAFLSQGMPVFAGTTGGLSGVITDMATGAPIAGVKIVASSPSETSTRYTDARGHFVFLALAPDTYVIAASKAQYDDTSQTGVSVFADNVNTVTIAMRPALKVIARVRSASAGALVKSGVTSDVYSVNAQTAEKAAVLGGGGNLDNTYSAIAAVPGVVVPTGGSGWNNNYVYIRGSQYFFTGFEFDGVPVNRAFDNYNASTESNLGLQELQVYTGQGPASNSSSGTAGFINQVIKTGTYPGYAAFNTGLGAPAYYHEARFELGGAAPNHNFSYYVGLSGYNQDYRVINQDNGASFMNPEGGPLEDYSTATDDSLAYGQGVIPICNLGVNATANVPTGSPPEPTLLPGPILQLPNVANGPDNPGCLYPQSGTIGYPSSISDRENVVNLHFGLPRKNGQRDDLQLLWSSSSLMTAYYSGSVNDNGFGLDGLTIAETGGAYCPPAEPANPSPFCTAGGGYTANYPNYTDDPAIYNVPFGTNVTNVATIPYYQPSSPLNRALDAPLPNDYRDTVWNDTGIVKLQLTHTLSDRAYLRAFGYSFFSDWTQAGAAASYDYYENGYGGWGSNDAENYDLITHTVGGELQFADQLSDQHLLQATFNYTKAGVMRFNNETASFGAYADPIGLISQDANGQYHCYDPNTGAETSCGNVVDSNSSSYVTPGLAGGLPTIPAGSPVSSWSNLWNNGTYGSYNTITPKFSFLSLTDEWRPSERLLFNAGVRLENYTYDLPDSTTAADNFYAQIFQKYACVSGPAVAVQPLGPGQQPPAPVLYTGLQGGSPAPCSSLDSTPGQFDNYVHPDCTGGDPCFSLASPSSYSMHYVSPRISMTYTESPDTVWRLSAGRSTEPPISASVQYLNYSGDMRSVWASSWQLGFTSPYHPIPIMSSAQYDGSLEHRIRGTDWSFKLSPFYNYTTGYQEQSFIGDNFVTQVPVGNFRSTGAELSIQKGNFNANGLSGMLSLTYTNAAVQYTDYFGQNQLSVLKDVINEYDKLTQAGGGSQCYTPAVGQPNPVSAQPVACGPGEIFNPYYSQSSIDPNSVLGKTWYPSTSNVLYPGLNTGAGFYDVPWTTALILNYRHNRFSVTPSLQIQSGTSYGNPLDVVGLDPRDCGMNQGPSSQGGTGIADAQPQAGGSYNCDYLQALSSGVTKYGTLYVPDPNIGTFDTIGQYKNPNIVLLNLQMSYDLTPRVSAQLTLADLAHTCFGGSSTPWSKLYTPGTVYCGYGSNEGNYVSNMYNGSSPTDTTANGVAPQPWQLQPYSPHLDNGLSSYFPFNAYLNFQIKV